MGKSQRSCAEAQAQHVGVSPQEDRGGTKGTVGEDTGEEEIGSLDWANGFSVGLSLKVHPYSQRQQNNRYNPEG
jgi:hypothetical protein